LSDFCVFVVMCLIIDFGWVLFFEVVVEGIEMVEVCDVVCDFGVDYV